MADNGRPILVTVIAVLYLLSAIMFLALGALLLAGGTAGLLTESENALATAGGGTLLVLGLIMFVLSYGFFKGWSIMWYLGVVLTALEILLNLAAILMGMLPNVILLVIEVLILWYLFRPKVKAFFLG